MLKDFKSCNYMLKFITLEKFPPFCVKTIDTKGCTTCRIGKNRTMTSLWRASVLQMYENISRMNITIEENKVHDTEILETFLEAFFRNTKVFRENWKCREQYYFYLFLFTCLLILFYTVLVVTLKSITLCEDKRR